MAFLCMLLFVPASAQAAARVQEVVSPGGIKAWLVEEHGLPLLAVKIAFTESGYAHDPAGKEGRTAMVSGLLMEGAGDLDSHAFNEAIESRAIGLRFSTDEDMLVASMETISDHKEQAFSYLGMALASPRFDNDAIERVRRQTLTLIRQQESQPGYKLHRAWETTVFPNHPYGKPVLGSVESVSALTRDDFAAYARSYLTRGNMVIAVAGDTTPEELGRLLDAHLGGLPASFAPDTAVTDTALPQEAQQVVVEHDIPQTMIRFGAAGLRRDDPLYYAAYVMNHILGGGGGLSSRLAVDIREKRGLAYSVFTQSAPLKHAGQWYGGFSTRNEKAGEALSVLKESLASFAANGPSDDEMARAKQYITGSFVLALDSNAEIANYLISMQINDLGIDYLEKRNALMNAVTKAQVTEVARRFADPARLQVIMVGKPKLEP